MNAAFVYIPAAPRPTTAGEASLWIGLVGAPVNRWLTTDEAFGDGAAAPRLTAPKVLHDGAATKVYLLGDEPGSGEAAFALEKASGAPVRRARS